MQFFRIPYSFLLILAFLTLALSTCALADDNVHIGAILPLTGEAAAIGKASQNAIQMALDELDPSLRSKLVVHFEDDQLSPKQAVLAFHNLVNKWPIDVFFNLSSGTANAIAPLTEERKIALLAVASDPKVSKGRKFAFNFWVTPESEAATAIEEVQRRGYKSLASIATIQEGALFIRDAFVKQSSGKLNVALSESYAPEVKDFKPFLTKLKSRGQVDGIVVVLLPGQLGIFAKQARQLGLKQDFIGFELFEDVNEVKVSAGALINQWYVNADEDPDFIAKYRARFPGETSYAAANSHDAIMLVADAAKTGHQGAQIADYLASVKDFSGACGKFSATGDQRFTLPATIKVVTKEGFDKLSR